MLSFKVMEAFLSIFCLFNTRYEHSYCKFDKTLANALIWQAVAIAEQNQSITEARLKKVYAYA
jgi:hypothetical protein